MGWNGLDLVNDFSVDAGDTTPAFKTKIMRWINDGIKEIATSHEWPFLREKGKVLLTADSDTHSIVLAKPSAPTIVLAAGGSLTLATVYKVVVTFFEAQSGVESIAGEESSTVIPVGSNLSLSLSAIPVSTCPLVTARKVYVSKGGGNFQYHGMISDNVATVYSVTTNPTSSSTPPEENAIYKIDGEFYLEDNRVLKGTSLQDLIYQASGRNTAGTPVMWTPINHEEIQVWPVPTADTVASFHYFKIPPKVFGTVLSIPQIPSWLYDDLRNYVSWRSYDFRDRAGKESKKLNFEQGLKLSISRKGGSKKGPGRVRSITPDSDGYLT
jgi:hypothetical protein